MKGLLVSFKRYFAFLILVLIIVLLLWLRLVVAPKVSQEGPANLLLSPTPFVPESLALPTNQPSLKKAPGLSSDSTPVLNYQGPGFSAPKTLPVLTLGGPSEVNLETAQKYAGLFGFSTAPVSPGKNSSGFSSFLWSEDDRVFSFNGPLPVLHFNNFNNLSFYASSSGLTTNQLLNTVKEQLVKLEVTGVNFENAVYKYYQTVNQDQAPRKVVLMETSDQKNASFVGAGLTYNAGGYPVFANSGTGFPLYFIFDPQGNIYEFTVYLLKNINIGNTLSLLPFNGAVKSLNQKGVIFFAQAKEDINQEELPFYSLKEVSLTNASLAYYLPADPTDKIYPFYFFTGSALENKTNKTVEIKVGLLAY